MLKSYWGNCQSSVVSRSVSLTVQFLGIALNKVDLQLFQDGKNLSWMLISW